MFQVLSFLAFFLSTFISAQVTSTSKFTDAWLSSYVIGLTYQISWTVGNDRPVSLTISNSTWSQDLACKFKTASSEIHWSLIHDSLAFLPPQTTTSFNWTVPSSLSSRSPYALSLSQNGPGSDVSPPFSIIGPATAQIPSPTTALPSPAPQNATMAMNGTILTLTSGCSGSGAAVTTSTYWDTRCGCMKTAVGPASQTGMPGGYNYTTPGMTGGTGVSGPIPSPYMPSQHGAAARLDVLSGKAGFLGVGFVAAISAFTIS